MDRIVLNAMLSKSHKNYKNIYNYEANFFVEKKAQIADYQLFALSLFAVPKAGFEPAHLAALAPETSVSAIPPLRQLFRYFRFKNFKF